jgi:hypothetical protein
MPSAIARELTRAQKLARVRRMYLTIAIHEAGHAFASWATSRRSGRSWTQIDCATIMSPDDIVDETPYINRHGREVHCLGIVEMSDRWDDRSHMLVGSLPRPILRDNNLSDAIVALAGLVAEAKYRKAWLATCLLNSGSSTDVDNVYAILGSYPGTDLDSAPTWAEVQRHARYIINKGWPAIVTLADCLLDQGTLEEDDIISIFERMAAADFPLGKLEPHE